jgi:hypothetical protein
MRTAVVACFGAVGMLLLYCAAVAIGQILTR